VIRLVKDTFLYQAKLSKHLTNILTSHINTGSQLIVGNERTREITITRFLFYLLLLFLIIYFLLILFHNVTVLNAIARSVNILSQIISKF